MEAADAPQLDAERHKLVRRSTRGAGQRGLPRRDNSMLCCLPMPSGWPRNEARAFGRPSGSARSGRWRIELSIRPVLKHGPRSLTCMRASGWQTHGGASNLTGGIPSQGAPSTDHDLL
ncbi:unnamed protein product [Calypogeia fissa]